MPVTAASSSPSTDFQQHTAGSAHHGQPVTHPLMSVMLADPDLAQLMQDNGVLDKPEFWVA